MVKNRKPAALTELETEVIRLMAECDLKMSWVARRMKYARSTVFYHVEEITRNTGLDPRKFYDMVKLLEMVKEG